MCIRDSPENWIKAGVEYVDGKQNVSAVVTHRTSDWSVDVYKRQDFKTVVTHAWRLYKSRPKNEDKQSFKTRKPVSYTHLIAFTHHRQRGCLHPPHGIRAVSGGDG